jgi:hypothetical protein
VCGLGVGVGVGVLLISLQRKVSVGMFYLYVNCASKVAGSTLPIIKVSVVSVRKGGLSILKVWLLVEKEQNGQEA